ncbi:hypothetical protein, partial [Natronolimnohabitans innermongolicus]|uniref:hypothetical protein n=1 Tax=Natronolimnohabitans innermongolicus TaxID=253107 RepID=UPI00126855A8
LTDTADAVSLLSSIPQRQLSSINNLLQKSVEQNHRDYELQEAYLTGISVSVDDYQLATGETETIYALDIEYEGVAENGDANTDSDAIEFSPVSIDPNSAVFGTYDPGDASRFYPTKITAEAPDGAVLTVLDFEDETNDWERLHDAIGEVESEVQSGINSYIDSIYEEVDSGEIEAVDILSPTDYIKEFGDADEVTRLHAELTGLGLAPPADAETTVTLSSDSDQIDDGLEGVLYLDWDWSELSPWEFELDDGELVIDDDSFLPESVYDLEFEDDEAAIPGDELEETDDGYVYQLDDEIVDDAGELETIEIDPAGELNSFIPTGEEVDVGHAVFVAIDGDDVERISFGDGDSFVIESIEDEDGDELDRYQITGYEQTARDPARALDQAAWYSEQRQTTDDMEEEGGPDIDITFPNPLDSDGATWLGLGLIGIVALAVIGFVTDLIPGLGE